MGNTSGIKWEGVSECTQPTLDVIGPNTQLILRDPKTKQEWVTTSQDYANFLVDNGILNVPSSGWGLEGNAGTDGTVNFIGTTDNQFLTFKANNIPLFALTPSNGFSLSTRAVFGSSSTTTYSTITTPANNRLEFKTFTSGSLKASILINGATDSIRLGTNGGIALKIDTNRNIGIGLDDNTDPISKLTVTGGDIEVTDIASGVIIKSPDNTRWRITVDNAGVISAASI